MINTSEHTSMDELAASQNDKLKAILKSRIEDFEKRKSEIRSLYYDLFKEFPSWY